FSDKDTAYFELSGEKDGGLSNQLANFIELFSKVFFGGVMLQTPKSWKSAFQLITEQLEKLPKSKKMVLFFDELPWLATKKSGMLQALDYYWNRHWSRYPNLKLIVCGSAVSWILEKLINAKGGLYNRLTKIIFLKPYSLKGTRNFLTSRGITLTPKQTLDLYMVFGGIPHYLKQVEKGKSVVQEINRICFQSDGLLYGEFDRLFASLFEHAEDSLSIVNAISERRQGITREELIQKTRFSSGGTLNKRLKELESCGFIQSYIPYGYKKKEIYYRLIDEYCYFYLSWIQPLKSRGMEGGKNYWQTKSKTPAALSWAGYTFETVCLKHVNEIKEALSLEAVSCEVGSWRYIPKKGSHEQGAQIDLLFDREDGAITLFEIRYSEHQLVVDKECAKSLKNKLEIFEKHTHAHKQIFIAMITTVGFKPTIWAEDLVQSVVLLNDLLT
ncbi:MAG: AAA family ATPase, partial [Verrucomicrobia bacterium]|nr:AAA family ATPase [Verrucomicrobiota bacterium]